MFGFRFSGNSVVRVRAITSRNSRHLEGTHLPADLTHHPHQLAEGYVLTDEHAHRSFGQNLKGQTWELPLH